MHYSDLAYQKFPDRLCIDYLTGHGLISLTYASKGIWK